ncbi:phosphoribosyltransferase [Candidatus Microgenomates bacterium]|nr:phosphoribosyltransferase [Candidatus Microgenomates bacterium]
MEVQLTNYGSRRDLGLSALFKDRREAGKNLAERLVEYKSFNPLILALPRGGVPVGYEIAKRLNAPLEVLPVRKLAAPGMREYAIGAIAPGGVKILDEEAIERLGISEDKLIEIEQEEEEELERRIKEYPGAKFIPDVGGKTVILVDDGVATGATARAAIQAVLAQNPDKLIVALPVCSAQAQESLVWAIRGGRDEIICLATPANFTSIGMWYENFDQVTDEDVVRILKESRKLYSKKPLHL